MSNPVTPLDALRTTRLRRGSSSTFALLPQGTESRMSLESSSSDVFKALQRTTNELLGATGHGTEAGDESGSGSGSRSGRGENRAGNELRVELQYGYHEIQGRRAEMEDAHMAMRVPPDVDAHGLACFGVFDGHGGQRAADWVSVNLYKMFLASDGFRSGNIEQGLEQAFLDTDEAFLKLAMDVSDPMEEMHDGTTAVVLVVIGDTLYVANCGDSEAVLCHAGKAVKLSETHNPKANEEEAQRILDVGGKLYNRRVGHPAFNPAVMSIAVSRSLGDAGFKHDRYTRGNPSGLIPDPWVTSRPVTVEDEFVILACDGLWDVMSPDEAVAMVCEHRDAGHDPQAIAEIISDWAYANGSTDNITVLVVMFNVDSDGSVASPAPSPLTHNLSSYSVLDPDAIHDDDDAVLIEKLRSRIKVLRRELIDREAAMDSLIDENAELKAALSAALNPTAGQDSASNPSDA